MGLPAHRRFWVQVGASNPVLSIVTLCFFFIPERLAPFLRMLVILQYYKRYAGETRARYDC